MRTVNGTAVLKSSALEISTAGRNSGVPPGTIALGRAVTGQVTNADVGETMSAVQQSEVWQRGAVEGFDPLLMPVVHALMQVREDIGRLAAAVPAEHVWQRPGGAASVGFHVRHAAGALDRLLTYARGEALSDEQRAAARVEAQAGEPPASLTAVVDEATRLIDRALEQVRVTSRESLTEARRVGRAELPSTVLGLVFHAAEHATRHVGQATTTARILAGL